MVQLAAAAFAIVIFAMLLSIGAQGYAVPFLFAALTLVCATFEDSRASRIAARVPWLADNTYGVYLWHIPVQLVLLLLLAHFGISRSIALSPLFLMLFLMTVFLVARLSFLLVERPMRHLIRTKLGKPRRTG